MSTAVPQVAPRPSVTFINIEDFDSEIPSSEVTKRDAQHAAQVRNPPVPFDFNTLLKLTANDGTSSGATGFLAPSVPDLGGINWIGKILEYHQAHPGKVPPVFTETTIPGFVPRFTCLVTLSERPEPFGSTAQPSSKKKDAKQYSCKLAIEWLVENGHMPSVDSVTFPKVYRQSVPQSQASISTTSAAFSVSPVIELSPAARVVEICQELRMTIPTYVMKNEPTTPMLWSGFAHFPFDPRVDGRVGEFTNVFGKKNAKDHCVKLVLDFLEGIKKHQGSTSMTG